METLAIIIVLTGGFLITLVAFGSWYIKQKKNKK